ncbi:LOW QUALITY PROTEIN: transposase [Opitutaceae bacterium TAV1]|nr:LOW QUALITY PROTEIN: transposase [Opitutaceae bacterium TAV1]
MKVQFSFWMKAYSQDLRERIIKARQDGAGAGETAKRYGVCKRTVERYWKRVNETGQCAELRRGGRRVSRLKPYLETLRGWIEVQNDLTLAEMLVRLRGELGVCIKRQALWHQLNRLGLTRIKKTLHAAEQDRADVKEARQRWRESQPSLPAEKLVFIDETGLNTKMTRLRGRCARGRRCVGRIPHGHYKTCTAIAALRHDRLCAPFVIDGAMNGEMFLAYVEKQLLPELAPGDIVICDNLSAHKNPAVKKLLEKHGCQLRHLPAYSPDLNPIEQAFSKLKSDVRGSCARQYEPLIHAVACSVRSFTPKLCKNLFAHANYATN